MEFYYISNLCMEEFDVAVNNNCKAEVLSVKMLESSRHHLEEGTLVVGSYCDLIKCRNFDSQRLCFVMFDVPPDAELDLQRFNIIIIKNNDQIPALLNRLFGLLLRDAEYKGSNSLGRLFESETLENLITQLSGVVRNPVLLINLKWEILIFSSGDEPLSDANLKMLTDERFCSSYLEYQMDLIHSGTIHTQRIIDDTHSALVRPILFDMTPVAILIEIDINEKMDETHKGVLGTAASIIQKRFSKDSVFYKKCKRTPMSDAYFRILVGEQQEYFSVEIMEGDIRSDCHQCVAVCALPGNSEARTHLLEYFETIPFTCAFVYQDYAVAITRMSSVCFSILRKHWDAVSKEFGLDIGVSEPFTGLKNLKKYLDTALIGLSYADYSRQDQDSVVSYYDYCRFYEALKNISPEDLIENYCAPAMHAIIKYDKKYATEYFKALRTFVYQDRNYKAAAAELNIHRNTLYYRITQIEKIYYDQTVWDPQFFFSLNYSFRLYDYCQKRMEILKRSEDSAE